nr:MAG TPA: Lysophosphatidic acid receptor 1, G protein-coupled receptor, DE [Caudoviricetes sp.]
MSRHLQMDLTGQRYGHLRVIDRASNQGSKVCWNCICDCGTRVTVQSFNLILGYTISCGCYRRERASQVHSKK